MIFLFWFALKNFYAFDRSVVSSIPFFKQNSLIRPWYIYIAHRSCLYCCEVEHINAIFVDGILDNFLWKCRIQNVRRKACHPRMSLCSHGCKVQQYTERERNSPAQEVRFRFLQSSVSTNPFLFEHSESNQWSNSHQIHNNFQNSTKIHSP